jgi:NADH dehydrogenase
MAVVGKNFALLQAPHVRLSGRLAWLVWAFIHLATLPRLQNRLRVGVQWLWSYVTSQRGSRLIVEPTWGAGDERPVVGGDSDRRPSVA